MKKIDPLLLVVSITAAGCFAEKAIPSSALVWLFFGAVASFALGYLLLAWYVFARLEDVPRRYRWLVRWFRSL